GGKTLLAQPIDRRLDVAAAFAQRLLAIHHPGAGLVAQFLDQPRGNLGHCFNPFLYSWAARGTHSAAGCASSVCSGAASAGASASSPTLSSSASGSSSAGASARAPISMPEAAISACKPSSTDWATRSQYMWIARMASSL